MQHDANSNMEAHVCIEKTFGIVSNLNLQKGLILLAQEKLKVINITIYYMPTDSTMLLHDVCSCPDVLGLK